MCCLPSHISDSDEKLRNQTEEKKMADDQDDQANLESSTALSNYVLIAAKDSKSGR